MCTPRVVVPTFNSTVKGPFLHAKGLAQVTKDLAFKVPFLVLV